MDSPLLPSSQQPLQATITPRGSVRTGRYSARDRLKAAAVELSSGIDGVVDALTPRAQVSPGAQQSQAGLESGGGAHAGAGDPTGSLLTRGQTQSPSSGFTSSAPGAQSLYSDMFRKCKACQGPIRGESIIVFDFYYHPHHFVCQNCNNVLDVTNFYTIDDEPHCAPCFSALNAQLCARCNQPCAPGTALFAMNKHWHPEHFACFECTAPLQSRFFNKGGEPHCEGCASRSRQVCAACNLPITMGAVTALGQTWHPEHILCAVCRAPLAGAGMVYERGGQPLCRAHFESVSTLPKCHSCSQEVAPSQQSTALGGKVWHREHFKCTFCWVPLGDAYQVSVVDDPYCNECFVKLF